MPHVFVSYDTSTLNFACEVGRQVEHAGLTAWIHPTSESGQQWEAWLEDYFRQSYALIAICAPGADRADLLYEWAFAAGAGAEVIPVTRGDCDLHPGLAARDPLDFPDGGARPWADLIARVQTAAGRWETARLAAPAGAAPELVALARSLHSPDLSARAEAMRALSVSDVPQARALLVAAARRAVYPGVRRAAVEALAASEGDWALEGLLGALADDDYDISRVAGNALAARGEAAVAGLSAAVRGDHRMASRAALLALSQIRAPGAVPGLIEGLGMAGWFAPRTAAVALGEIGDPRAIAPLVEALGRGDPHLAALAAEALRRIGTPEALAALDPASR